MRKKGFKIYPDTKVFVVCPADVKTGGTEVIHQLVNILQEKMDAYVWYVFLKKPFVPIEFKKYECRMKLRLEKIHDNTHNILITPETCTRFLGSYRYIQKAIWWLSVDNYISTIERVNLENRGKGLLLRQILNDEFLFGYNKNKIVHLVQSYYADEYLRVKGIFNRLFLSDYINDIYLQINLKKKKKDIILYNPKKGMDFTKKIIQVASDLTFFPIENMTTAEIADVMQESKVYIDFGNHPGKDRLPREAAISGMCIITGKKGAAQNAYDVMIPQKYKFTDSEKEIVSIVACIRKCLDDYEYVVKQFDLYRKEILSEKKKFQDAAEKIFQIGQE